MIGTDAKYAQPNPGLANADFEQQCNQGTKV